MNEEKLKQCADVTTTQLAAIALDRLATGYGEQKMKGSDMKAFTESLTTSSLLCLCLCDAEARVLCSIAGRDATSAEAGMLNGKLKGSVIQTLAERRLQEGEGKFNFELKEALASMPMVNNPLGDLLCSAIPEHSWENMYNLAKEGAETLHHEVEILKEKMNDTPN